MNIDEPISAEELWSAEQRVLKIQTKLHQWASNDPSRVFADLFNLVVDPAFLMIAWDRVRGNQGARSAGVDGVRPRLLQSVERAFLTGLREQIKSGKFTPLPAREPMIPKRSGKLRALGIPTAADRVVQASLKLVLEPIFEADFHPCSYGFRPKRRAQDAIAEIHMLASNAYEWVLDADISACFDEISHSALLSRVRRRIADKRVLGLVKAFLPPTAMPLTLTAGKSATAPSLLCMTSFRPIMSFLCLGLSLADLASWADPAASGESRGPLNLVPWPATPLSARGGKQVLSPMPSICPIR